MSNLPEDVFAESKFPPKDQRVLGAVCYFPLGFIVPSVVGKGNEDFVAHHVRFGAAYFVVTFLTSFVVGSALWLFYLLISGWSAFKAFSGERYVPGFAQAIIDAVKK